MRADLDLHFAGKISHYYSFIYIPFLETVKYFSPNQKLNPIHEMDSDFHFPEI